VQCSRASRLEAGIQQSRAFRASSRMQESGTDARARFDRRRVRDGAAAPPLSASQKLLASPKKPQVAAGQVRLKRPTLRRSRTPSSSTFGSQTLSRCSRLSLHDLGARSFLLSARASGYMLQRSELRCRDPRRRHRPDVSLLLRHDGHALFAPVVQLGHTLPSLLTERRLAVRQGE